MDMNISRLTLGTVQLGMNYGISNTGGKPNMADAHKILSIAEKNNVTLLDTSSDYGNSEAVIGEYLKAHEDSHFQIATKFTVVSDDESELSVEKSLRRTIENSLSELNVSCLDLLLVHNESDVLKYSAVLPKLLTKMKNEKLISHIGASINTSAAIDTILSFEAYEAVQLPFNIFDTARLHDGTLKRLSDCGITVFVRSVFLQGLFFMNPEELPKGVLQGAIEPLRQLRRLAERENMSVAELAVSFVRDIPEISSLVLGVATPSQMEENIKLISAPALSESTRADIENMYKSIPPEVMMPWKWNR